MTTKQKNAAPRPEEFCKSEIERMLKNSQTKVIMPVVTLGLLDAYCAEKKLSFSDPEIRKAYEGAVRNMKQFLGHDVHIGAKYEDAYGMRMSRYGVLAVTGHLQYALQSPYTTCAAEITRWIPSRIKEHISDRLGIVPLLRDAAARLPYADDQQRFVELIREQIGKTSANFEIFSFAVIKVHLEKFACKVYRDTRTAAHDNGVDLSTNFGVIYQIKKLRVRTEAEAARVYTELESNFGTERIHDHNVILVIDNISRDVKKYLLDMKVQSISKNDLLKIASGFDEPEDRQRVLRVVYDEFRREYSSTIM